MRRRTLDVLFSAGGVAVAGLLLVLGVVLTSNATFAEHYVRDQLRQQRISFPVRSDLSAEESVSACLLANAGKPLETGRQAECYANDYIALHVAALADGKTYAELGAPQTALRAQVAAARSSADPALPELEKQLADISATRETLFKGETLRGLLLTSFGFSEFGVKAGQASIVTFLGAVLLALLAAAGFIHAFRTPRSEAFAPALSSRSAPVPA
jgi:hypothetical protein